MMMETQEAMASKDVVKGKRTKRQRPPSPPTLTMVSSSSSGGAGGGGRGGGGAISDNSGGILDRSTTSPTTSAEFTDSTEEEEDMANCLILLAQGRHSRKLSEPIAAAASAAATKVGLYVYPCKTCNRCFPSFQALGGHRASHKKLKANIEDQKKMMYLIEEGDDRFSHTSTTLSLQIPNRAKFHECSICGAEFTSGQALGGHMRRHRSTFTSSAAAASTTMSLGTSSSPESTQAAMVKQRNVVELDLDLNLPAPPEDGHRESKFSFKSKEQVIVFSASSLVDCHY